MKKILFVLLLANTQLSAQNIQFWRPYDQRGINVFETPKEDSIPFQQLKVRLGGSFTQQFQALNHSNQALEKLDQQGNNLNQLIEIGPGFNNATANLNIDVQLEDGIRLNLVTYLSSRHHPEAWVKGGFIQIDKLNFLKSAFADRLMENLTLRVGHMEINYGDAHFRRTDNGNAFYNPFVGNYILDAFTTEIGGDVTFQKNGWLLVAGVTGGEIKGEIINPGKRKPSFIGKAGYDNNLNENLRVRLTGSVYHTDASVSNTLYAGDRAGSRYYLVMENTLANPANNFMSGRFVPGFRDKVTAFVINPFVKFHGLELFGNLEMANGRSSNETKERTVAQLGGDLVYRIGKRENFYLAARYQQVAGEIPTGKNIIIDRIQAGGGWFPTKNLLLKLEYVNQNYGNFAPTDIRHEGNFNGIMLEAAVAF